MEAAQLYLPRSFFPARSLNRRFPVSETREYITPFMCPLPITPTTFLLLFTALLLFNDHARNWRKQNQISIRFCQHSWVQKRLDMKYLNRLRNEGAGSREFWEKDRCLCCCLQQILLLSFENCRNVENLLLLPFWMLIISEFELLTVSRSCMRGGSSEGYDKLSCSYSWKLLSPSTGSWKF